MLRSGIGQVLSLILSTPSGQEMVESEVVPPGYTPLMPDSAGLEIDARARRFGNSFFHGAGSASMGKMVDSELRVKVLQT
jgi:hypothetical protein